MESEPHLEAGPPALIESAVRLLVPPVAREHVLGDLAERYSSPRQYLLDAARTVPFVVVSQIRRTSYFAFWPMVALMLTSGFGGGAAGILAAGRDPGARHDDRLHVPRRLPSSVISSIRGDRGSSTSSVAAASALASQAIVAVVRPEWLIAPAGVAGGGIVLAMLYLLRVQNPTGRVPRPVPVAHGRR